MAVTDPPSSAPGRPAAEPVRASAGVRPTTSGATGRGRGRAAVLAMLAGRGWSGQAGCGRCRPEQGGHRLERLGEGGLVLPDRGVECLLVGADELLLVVRLD